MIRENKAAPQDCQSDQMDRTVGRDRSGLNGRTKRATANRSATMPRSSAARHGSSAAIEKMSGQLPRNRARQRRAGIRLAMLQSLGA